MVSDQQPCRCGRSPDGLCVGLHNMTNEQYKKYLEEQHKMLNEQTKQQFLTEG
jgi:hypothetical protein